MPPIKDEWRSHFPVGVYIATQTAQYRAAGNTTGTVTVDPNVQSHWSRLLNHPEQGLRSVGLTHVFPAAAQVYNWEDVQGISGWIDTESGKPMFKSYMGIGGRTHPTDNATGIDGDWYVRSSANQTYADALTFAAPLVANFQDHSSILGYHFGDDITVGNKGQATVTLTRAIQDLDPYGRPVINTVTDPNVWALPDGDKLKVVCFYRYPAGKTTGGAVALEGDFHRNTFDGYGGDTDWVDAIRFYTSRLPAGCEGRFHMILQNHGTVDDGASLRPTTEKEVRKQFWIAVGEGAKGIWMFPWDGSTDADNSLTANSWGIGDIHEVAKLQAYGECSQRLKPEIRRALLDCNRVTDKFTTSGGGSTGYPVNYASAYVSTLYDAKRDLYYCVVCNNSLSQANVTISSATLTGKLINLETNAEMRLPVTAALPALDGTIYRYDPDYGVPHTDIDWGQTVTQFWDAHWMNPAAPGYRNTASIKTWPNEVIVDPGGTNLQDAINAAPDRTTFRLKAGTHNYAVITGKQHLHFIADNPANRPTCQGFRVIGTQYFVYYNGSSAPTFGFQYYLGQRTKAALDAHWEPPRDLYFQNIDFDSSWTVLFWDYRAMYSTAVPTGYYQHDHISLTQPIFIRNFQDVLVDNCTFSNAVWGDDPHDTVHNPFATPLPTPPTPVGQSSANGPIGGHYPAMCGGNNGTRSFNVRNCTFNGSSNARGAPRGYFSDGSRGCVLYNNTFTGKYNSGQVLFLTNDDVTDDINGDGRLQIDREYRSAMYNCVVNNTFAVDGEPVAFTGNNNLFKGNTMAIGNGTVGTFVSFSTRCHKYWYRGETYRSYRNTVIGNTITGVGGRVVRYVTTYPASGFCADAGGNPRFYGKIGQTVVMNNVGPTTVDTWLADHPNDVTAGYTSEGGDTVSGNTP